MSNVELSVYQIDKDELAELKKVFPRGSFTLLNQPNREEKMMFAPLKPPFSSEVIVHQGSRRTAFEKRSQLCARWCHACGA